MANDIQQDAIPEQWPVDCKYRPSGILLGKGHFGRVYTMYRQRDGKEFALKLIPRVMPNKRADVATHAKLAERELQSWARLFHPHIVEFKECFVTPLYLCIVLELVKGMTLHAFVNERQGLPEKQARFLFQQLIFAIEYCHLEQIVHRDIKLENTLLDQTKSTDWPYVKLTDFGFSKCTTLSVCHTEGIGTSAYMAPEVLDGAKNNYDGKVDVWSAGVMLYAMLYCQYPFGVPENGIMADEMKQRIRGVDLDIPAKAPGNTGPVSELCTSFIRQLLDGSPKSRLSVAEVIRHPWFQFDLPPGAEKLNEMCRAAPRKPPQSQEAISAIVREAFAIHGHGFSSGYWGGRSHPAQQQAFVGRSHENSNASHGFQADSIMHQEAGSGSGCKGSMDWSANESARSSMTRKP